MNKNKFDDYNNSRWDGVDKVMLRFSVWWIVGWTILAVGLYIYHM